MTALAKQKLTLDEYLVWENEQPEKHEFHLGEVYAMVGGRRVHGRLVMNLGRRLSEALDGSRCQVFAESMKLQVADEAVLYPDVFITCDAADLEAEMVFRAPTVIFEVLSPSTQGYDRSDKFALYRKLASLREYVLVDPDTRRVEAFRRNAAGEWVFADMSGQDSLTIPALEIALKMDDVFAGLDAA